MLINMERINPNVISSKYFSKADSCPKCVKPRHWIVLCGSIPFDRMCRIMRDAYHCIASQPRWFFAVQAMPLLIITILIHSASCPFWLIQVISESFSHTQLHWNQIANVMWTYAEKGGIHHNRSSYARLGHISAMFILFSQCLSRTVSTHRASVTEEAIFPLRMLKRIFVVWRDRRLLNYSQQLTCPNCFGKWNALRHLKCQLIWNAELRCKHWNPCSLQLISPNFWWKKPITAITDLVIDKQAYSIGLKWFNLLAELSHFNEYDILTTVVSPRRIFFSLGTEIIRKTFHSNH